MNKNQKGFSVIEVVLLLVIIGVLGFVGWFVWSRRSKPQTVTTNTQPAQSLQTTPTSATSLKEATLPTEKLSFKYPSSWSIDNKVVKKGQDPGATYEEDIATLTGTNGFTMTIASGLDRTHDAVYGSTGSKVFQKESFELWQGTLYIFFTGAAGNGSGVQAVEVSGDNEVCATNCFFTSKNTQGELSVSGSYYDIDTGKYKNMSLDEFKKDPNIVAAVAVIKSLHY
jgi:Tfp pilus assembly protein PilV